MEIGEPPCCRLCGFAGSDVRLDPCGCTLHARCVPLNLIIVRPQGSNGIEAAKPKTQQCPVCHAAPVSSIYILPMQLHDLDHASQLKRQQAASNAAANHHSTKQSMSSSGNDNGKRAAAPDASSSSSMLHDLLEVQAESPYLLLLGHGTNASSSASLSNSSGMDSDYLRTGRWTEEETAYVDYLVESFDRGQLVMPQGMRLNDMLRDLLLCKASRLTKKLKHAKLSARSYNVQPMAESEVNAAAVAASSTGQQQQHGLNRVMLSTLEQQFLESIPLEATRLELRCILSKAWRSFLSNLCLQVGSEMLNANDWITSLEMVEARASQAEAVIRNARRRRMGMALKTDLKSANHGVFISGHCQPPSKRQAVTEQIHHMIPTSVEVNTNASSGQSVATTSSSQGDHDSEYISQILDFGDNMNQAMMMMGGSSGNSASGQNNNTNMEYLSMLFDTLVDKKPFSSDASAESPTNIDSHARNSNCGPFLDTLMSFVEQHNLPFEHIDVWVPSFHNNAEQEQNGQEMRLFHAGYVTRADVDPARFAQLNEYGEYSTKFSFRPGCGLPGRVYTTGEPSWERNICDVDPKIFERAGGARVYRVNTGFGIPLSTPAISRMVVVMYSGTDVAEDSNVMQMVQTELASYDPEPKWKLVVDMPTHQGSIRHRSASVGSANSSIASKLAAAAKIDPQEEEYRIATLLGDHIPLNEAPGQSSELAVPFVRPETLIPHFVYLRLLLLRSREKRAAAENEAIEIIRKSYRGYVHDSRRSEKDVAFLIVRDWQFLHQGAQAIAPVQQRSHQPVPPAPQPKPEQQYTSHQFGVVNNLSTYASGGPTRMPSVLSFVDPSMVGRKNSLDGQHPGNVNIVDEHTD
ncbi:hypothetical protein MPSEU_000412600 [Mayamaea pseudoterrestris]|nr:hypothetical protein MPSEU_000412600 [Mayamaea pseudoterrestris]